MQMTPSRLTGNPAIGWWHGNEIPQAGSMDINEAITRVTDPVFLINKDGQLAVSREGSILIGRDVVTGSKGYPLVAYVPELHPENLGDISFKNRHHIRYPYICGAMANGISSIEMVEKAGRAGMLGFFGAAGLSIDEIDDAGNELQQRMDTLPYGFNLIHSPNDPEHEAATAQLYLNRRIKLVSASAYLNITLPLVYYRVKGIHEDAEGNIVCPNKIIAKVSRIEIAKKFLSPPPEKLLSQLVDQKLITRQEASLAKMIPVAEDLTAEADSGGHTDNRPAISLLPTMIALRDEADAQYHYLRPPSIGLGGGISTPYSAAAAFAMGAAYIVTGSVNQSCIEAGTSEIVRKMLAEAHQADVAMAPAADMFEIGAKVQVLKRGTMFPLRAAKLYDLYNRYEKYESIPPAQQQILERDFFKRSFQNEWNQVEEYFEKIDPKQIIRAKKDPKHKMGLVFRSYLGQSSMWAIAGDPSRKMDYQIWCGPAIGAFNQWVKGTFLEKPENRETVTIAMNLLLGASVVTRINWLRNQAVFLPESTGKFSPLPLSEIHHILNSSFAP